MIRIRQAMVEDLDRMVEVEQSAFEPDRWASRETLAIRMGLYPKGCLVLECEGKIVGFSTALLTDDIKNLAELDIPDWELHKPDGEVYELRSVAIRHDYQRRGLGTLLTKKQLENAQRLGKKHFRFTAAEDVEGFYAKLGFERLTKYEPFHGVPQALWEKN